MKCSYSCRWPLAAFATVALIGVAERRAEACSHPCIQRSPVLVAPVDDASDVPLDAEIKLRWDGYFGGEPGEGTFELRVANGAVVPVTTQVTSMSSGWARAIVLRPGAPLEANTIYEVRWPDSSSAGLSPIIGYFTTGATSLGDTTPIAPSDSPQIFLVSTTHTCGRDDMPACCDGAPVMDVIFQPGIMGGPTVRTFTIREDNQVIASNLLGVENGMVVCKSDTYLDCGYLDRPYSWTLPPGDHTLSVVAVDLAGHESATVTRGLTLTCGDVPAPDAGVPDAGIAAEDDSDSGCACRVGASHTSRAAAWPALLALVFVGRRVTRKPSRPSPAGR